MTEALRGGSFDALELAAGRGDVLLVGHEPDFSDEVGRLTGANVALKKGGIAVVDGSTLVALLAAEGAQADRALRCPLRSFARCCLGWDKRRRAGQPAIR